jgi:hypothetical protein
MKKLLLVLLLVVFSANAQDPILTDTTWYLTSLVQSGNAMTPPSDFSVPNVPLTFMPGSESYQIMTSVCNSGFGEPISFPTANTFTYEYFGVTLALCVVPANGTFDNAYFSFYVNNINLPLTYTITGIANEYALTITSTSGDMAIYSSTQLGNRTPVNGVFAVSPNPTNGEIALEIENPGQGEVSLFNTLGQKVLSKKYQLLPGVLDISNFEAGIYLLEISGASGKASKKIIKI